MMIVCAMVVGPNEKRLEQALDDIKWVDEIFICANHESVITQIAGLKTELKDKITIRKDLRTWGEEQYRIKQDFFYNSIVPAIKSGDWIIWKDADEVFYNFGRKEAEELAEKGGAGFNFYIVNLLEDGYSRKQSFWNVRYWQYVPELNNNWQRRNLHCGNYPLDVYRRANFAPYLLLHYGLKDKDDRERKTARYKKYDPQNRWMRLNDSYYKFLEEKPIVSPLDLEDLEKQAIDFAKNTYHKPINITNMTEEKVIYFRRKSDGALIPCPEKLATDYRNQQDPRTREKMFDEIGEAESAVVGGKEEEAPEVELPFETNEKTNEDNNVGVGDNTEVSEGKLEDNGDLRHQGKPARQKKGAGKKVNRTDGGKRKTK